MGFHYAADMHVASIRLPIFAGPNYSEAVQLFISAFQAWLEDMHIHTEHVINSVQVATHGLPIQCVYECVSVCESAAVAFCHPQEMCSDPLVSKHQTLH